MSNQFTGAFPIGEIVCIKDSGVHRNWIKTSENTPNGNGNFMRLAKFRMENFLGRKLKSSEIVHHINEDPTDDKIENLMIINRSEHTSLHRKGKTPKEAILASSLKCKHRRQTLKPRVIKLYSEGKSLRMISGEMRISRNLVTKIVRGE